MPRSRATTISRYRTYPPTESLKECAMTKKPKANKNLNKGDEALNEVAKETKKQVELIERQIADIKVPKG